MKVHLLHDKPPEKIRKIVGTHNFREYILEITNVPTKKRGYGVGYIIFRNRFPEELWEKTNLALEHYVLSYFYKHTKKEGLGWITFQRPTMALIQRSGIQLDKEADKIKVMFHFKTPLKGRKINGKAMARAFETVIPKMIKDVQYVNEDKKSQILEIKKSVEDQMEIRRQLVERGYIAFIGDNITIGGAVLRTSDPGMARVPHAGRIRGIWIPEGRTLFENTRIELFELLGRGYAYYKPEAPNAMVKTIRDIAWVSGGEEWLASYSDMKAVMGVGNLEYPNAIMFDSGKTPHYKLVQEGDSISLYKTGDKTQLRKPEYQEVMVRKALPKVKLSHSGVYFSKTNMAVPYHLQSTLVERNQLRAVVDAINFAQKYVNGKKDICHAVGKTMNVISKKGINTLGLDFYTEFTRWQFFYMMYKLVQANP